MLNFFAGLLVPHLRSGSRSGVSGGVWCLNRRRISTVRPSSLSSVSKDGATFAAVARLGTLDLREMRSKSARTISSLTFFELAMNAQDIKN